MKIAVRTLTVIAVLWSFYQLTVGVNPLVMDPWLHLLLHLGLAVVVGVLDQIVQARRPVVKALYGLAGLAFVGATAYLWLNAQRIQFMPGIWDGMDVLASAVIVLVLLEMVRRYFGWSMVIIALVFMAWGAGGNYLPGLLRNAGFPLRELLPTLVLSGDGVYGSLLASSAQFIFLFVLFGAVLLELGGGDFLADVAARLVGWTRGGAAKIAVISSFLFGMASGSTTANVSTTGSLTIPLMRRTGFSAPTAAGIEAASAVGGQIMPPVMGATAFLMADILGMPYGQLIKHAFIPGALYYLSLLVAVDEEAALSGFEGITGLPPLSLPKVMKDVIVFIPAFFVLFYLIMVTNLSASLAASLATLLMIALYLMVHRDFDSLKKVGRGLAKGAENAVRVALITATIGIVMGVILKTGLGMKIASAVVALAGGGTFSLLLLTAVAVVILGSGLPSTATYVIVLVLVLSSLTDRGIAPLLSHLYIFYWGVISDISPPTMATVYVSASLAKAPIGATSLVALRLAVAGMVVPFIFVYQPQLVLLTGSPWEQIVVVGATAIGVGAISKFLTRLAGRRWGDWRTWLMGAAGAALFVPSLPLRATAVVALAAMTVRNRSPRRPPNIGAEPVQSSHD